MPSPVLPMRPRPTAHQVMKAIQKHAPEIMDELGLDLYSLIDKHLRPALEAREVKVFSNDGKILYSKELPAHDIQMRALDLAFKLRGYAPRDPVLAAQIGVKVIVVPKELRPDREEFYKQQEEEKTEES